MEQSAIEQDDQQRHGGGSRLGQQRRGESRRGEKIVKISTPRRVPQVEPNGGQRKQGQKESAALGDPGDRLDLQGVNREEQGPGAGGDVETPSDDGVVAGRRRGHAHRQQPPQNHQRQERAADVQEEVAEVKDGGRQSDGRVRPRHAPSDNGLQGEPRIAQGNVKSPVRPAPRGGDSLPGRRIHQGVVNDLLPIVPVEELKAGDLTINNRDDHDQQHAAGQRPRRCGWIISEPMSIPPILPAPPRVDNVVGMGYARSEVVESSCCSARLKGSASYRRVALAAGQRAASGGTGSASVQQKHWQSQCHPAAEFRRATMVCRRVGLMTMASTRAVRRAAFSRLISVGLVLAAMLLAAARALPGLGTYPFWDDEANTAIYARNFALRPHDRLGRRELDELQPWGGAGGRPRPRASRAAAAGLRRGGGNARLRRDDRRRTVALRARRHRLVGTAGRLVAAALWTAISLLAAAVAAGPQSRLFALHSQLPLLFPWGVLLAVGLASSGPGTRGRGRLHGSPLDRRSLLRYAAAAASFSSFC